MANRIAASISALLKKDNRFSTLPVAVHFILFALIAGHFIFFLYVIRTTPYHYDEAWSYLYFSGNGIWHTMREYPAPNNHVFYNVVARLFVLLQIDTITAVRLPNAIACVAAIWYFFKLCMRLFPVWVSLASTTLFTISFSILYYATMGRGYGMLLLFAVLCLYGAIAILQEATPKKYFIIFAVAAILGFYTIPSYLYFFAPLFAVLLLHIAVWHPKLLGRFIIASIAIASLTILLYMPIISHNGYRVLTSNNGVVLQTSEYIQQHAVEHFEATWRWLLGFDISLTWLLPFLIYLFITSVYGRGEVKKLIALLSLVMLLLPVAVVFIQKVIPFERTWCHLTIPIILTLGLLLADVAIIIGYIFNCWPPYSNTFGYIILTVLLCWLVIKNNTHFLQRRHDMHNVDYITAHYAQLLSGKINQIQSICYPNENLNFYLAEDLQFEGFRRDNNHRINLSALDPNSTPSCDVVIFEPGKDTGYVLTNYMPMLYDNNLWKVYLRKGL